MEQLQPEENTTTTPVSDNKKRKRVDDTPSDSPDSKLARLHSPDSEPNLTQLDADSTEPGFDSDNSGVSSPDAKRIQDELLSVLDDSDEPPVQGLDSVIKSFEEEILPVQDVITSFSVEAQPDLGYLLEASDDELGLPSTFSAENKSDDGNNVGTAGNLEGLGDLYGGFEELGGGYEWSELGVGDENRSYNEGEGFVTLGRLFDYPDESFGSSDTSGLPLSLSAS